jgi:octaprenyl-diphosphate synthase
MVLSTPIFFGRLPLMSSVKTEIATDTAGYDAYLEEARKAIALELSNVVQKIPDLQLGEKIQYVLQTQGKRLRPVLVMLSAQSLGGKPESVKQLALAIELLHSATLLHDDILDQDTFRRNALTANAKWGVRDAVLVGDALASISLHLAADYDSEIVKILSRTCLWLSDGEYMDIENGAEPKSESDYIGMIRKKSACLFQAATECGAIAAKGSRDEIHLLGTFGENFGLAYQIKDDLSDMFPFEGALPQDINEFRATLPIIHLCASSPPRVRDRMLKAIASVKIQSPQQRATNLRKLCEGLENTGSWQYCVDKIHAYVETAIESLEPLTGSVYKTYLVRMAGGLRIKHQAGQAKRGNERRERFISIRT